MPGTHVRQSRAPRSNMTDAERLLWRQLRLKRIGDHLKAEIAKWGRVVKATGARVD